MKVSRSSAAVGILIVATCFAARAGETAATADAGNFVRALWFVQSFGNSEAADPRRDERTKAKLATVLGEDGSLSIKGAKGMMDPKRFTLLAGVDSRLDAKEIAEALATRAPAERGRLFPPILSHCQALTTSFDRIDERHLAVAEELAAWIIVNYQAGQRLDLVFVCTGNSRRSVLGAAMGNIAAAYYGLPEIRCHSGGTAPTACNERTVAALRAIGVEIEPTGEQAPEGPAGGVNPVFQLRWGQAATGEGPAMESTEFSKRYDDESNPSSGFAALMVCGEADAECPRVQGAKIRISTPCLDPKIYDGSEFESSKYAERRDDFGRLMLSAMSQVRRRLDERGE